MITAKTKHRLQLLLRDLEVTQDMSRIIILLQCLQIIASETVHISAYNKEKWDPKLKDQEYINKISDFTIRNFQENITLSQVASLVYMSVPSFCIHFKRWMGKTYFDYLNEVRIENACRMLTETNLLVTDICYDSGFNTSAHFHRQFFRLKEMTPLQYRKAFFVELSNKEADVRNIYGENQINTISA
jgi:AraC-like DNA-binding protein